MMKKAWIGVVACVAAAGTACIQATQKPGKTLVKPAGVMTEESPLLGMERFGNLKRLGRIAARRSETIEASRWGLQFNKHDLPEEHLDMFLERIAESGVKWARVETRGYPVKYSQVKQQGYYRWQELDRIVQGLAKRKINMFICFDEEVLKKKGRDPKDLERWLEYVRALVKRYGGLVKHWEILNEPGVSPEYAQVVKAASKTIRAMDSEAIILAGSIARVNLENLQRLIEEFKIGPYIDVITYHPYDEFPEGSKNLFLVPVQDRGYLPSSHLISEMRAVVKREKNPIELWQGECGYPSSEHTSSWKGRGPWGENIQAKWLLRRFLVDLSMDIPVTVYFLLREPPENGRVNAKGLLYYGTWKPKAGYRALQHLTSVFDQRLMKPKNVSIRFEFVDEGGFPGVKGEHTNRKDKKDKPYSGAKSPYLIEVVGLTGSGGDAVTYWQPWRMQEYIKPAKVNLIISGARVDDPVLVDLLTGDVYGLKTYIRDDALVVEGAMLTDYPLAIVSRKIVTMK